MTESIQIKPTPAAPLFSSRFARSLIRAAGRLGNPLLERLVRRGWIPSFGIVLHHGRRTGRLYVTPVGLGMTDGAFHIPLTFGDHSYWYQNVAAAGECTVVWRGHERRAGNPSVVEGAHGRGAFPAPLRLALRLLGINRFLRLEPIGVAA